MKEGEIQLDHHVAGLISRRLLRWYRAEGRHELPWRLTQDPWRILLAELMLQRTRADLVEPIYVSLTAEFPTAAALADAPIDRLGSVMQPLGLRHRIERIQRAAVAVSRSVPRTREQLLRVPGVGPYAAAATLCFAYGRRVPIVDPSVIRILERLLGMRSDRPRPRTDPLLWSTAEALMPARGPRDWNWAVLDLGALVCRPRPRCPVCPLQELCPTGRSHLNIDRSRVDSSDLVFTRVTSYPSRA